MKAEVADACESHDERRIQGVVREMTLRHSYLIAPGGTIEATYENGMPYDHPPDILADVAEIEHR